MTTVSSDADPQVDVPRGGSGHGRGALLSFGNAPSPWRGGLAAARRHTSRVRILRIGALAVSLTAVGIVVSGALLAPSKNVPGGLSAERVTFDGTKVTLESPNISGFQIDRRPYSIKARRAVQDLARPEVIELQEIEAGIGTSDEQTMQVAASRAKYDSQNEQILLDGNVRIARADGYDLALESARVDFAAGTMISDSAVVLKLDGATIAAESMILDDRHHVITFDGGVKSSISPRGGQQADRDAPEANAATQ